MAGPGLPSVGPLHAYAEPPSVVRMGRAFAALLSARRHPDRLADAAAERALEVVGAAQRTVPYYRGLYGDRSFDRLDQVPVIDKAALVAHPLEHRLAGPVPMGSHHIHTAGTTGVPFTAIYPPAFARWQGLLRLRTDLDRRAAPWTRSVALTFARDSSEHRQRAAAWFDRYQLTVPLDAPTEDIVERIRHWRPRRISGHPHRVLDVGRMLPVELRPTVVRTHGEVLEPVLRSSLERVFSSAPLDSYGTAEVGAVAAQCLAVDLYHLQQESVLVEVLDDDGLPVGPGGTGDCVVTGLHNGLMPIIRYRLDDRVTLAGRLCACGHAGPALTAIDGRSADFAVGRRGERISPERIWLFSHAPQDVITENVRRYQVHQRAGGEIVLRLELRRPLPAAVLDQVLASYRRESAGQPVSVEIVDDISAGRAGKFRLIASDLADAAGHPVAPS